MKAEWIQLWVLVIWEKNPANKIWNFIFRTKDGVIFCLLVMNETYDPEFTTNMKPQPIGNPIW